jgi:glycosyltransferase involved in cell wall biosynthesis
MKISVAMTTYNGARFVKQQLESIIEQERRPDELIVCDDRSVDGTVDIVMEHVRNSPFSVRLLRNPQRLGSTQNFAKAIGECTGDLVALADQDDIWLPHKLARCEALFQARPDAGLMFSNAWLMDENGAELNGDLWSAFRFGRKRQALVRAQRAHGLLLRHSFVTGATMVFRRQLAHLFLPFPRDLPLFVHDRWAVLLASAISKVDFIDEPLIRYRVHSHQQIGVGHRVRAHQRVGKALRDDGLRKRGQLDALDELTVTLERRSEAVPHAAFTQALRDTREHYCVRNSYPAGVWARCRAVARELRTGRYGTYSSGLLSAYNDMRA